MSRPGCRATTPAAGFNEARADSPGKSVAVAVLEVDVRTASMRPGLIRPGNGARSAAFRAGRPRASMRPGLIRPGNMPRPWRVSRRFGCFNEARADSPGKLAVGALAKTPIPGFNEARADSPGKSLEADSEALGNTCFNEARADSPGKCTTLCPTRGSGRRFNEARADSPGKSRVARRYRIPPHTLQ